ncbi:MAG: hypothetical protein WCI74_07530 [Actinomycetes bacterium]
MIGAASYLAALALTMIVETPIYYLMLSRLAHVRSQQAIIAGIVVNLISHPLFTAVLVPAAEQVMSPIASVLVGEAVVCALEAGLLYAWLRRDAAIVIAASLMANGCSFAVGLVLMTLIFRS